MDRNPEKATSEPLLEEKKSRGGTSSASSDTGAELTVVPSRSAATRPAQFQHHNIDVKHERSDGDDFAWQTLSEEDDLDPEAKQGGIANLGLSLREESTALCIQLGHDMTKYIQQVKGILVTAERRLRSSCYPGFLQMSLSSDSINKVELIKALIMPGTVPASLASQYLFPYTQKCSIQSILATLHPRAALVSGTSALIISFIAILAAVDDKDKRWAVMSIFIALAVGIIGGYAWGRKKLRDLKQSPPSSGEPSLEAQLTTVFADLQQLITTPQSQTFVQAWLQQQERTEAMALMPGYLSGSLG